MTLLSLKQHIESFPRGTVFNYGLSEPFSWRGVYSEVAFGILETPMTREAVLEQIKIAYSETFEGYKGGEYRYDDYTTVNFEDENLGCAGYTNGGYASSMISKIEGTPEYKSQEERLASLAFSVNYKKHNHTQQ